ncbi:cellulase family glycosylhydrolase [Marinicellulosiphila megalodicopiae]|uniref:cellulase family glycosylhydrolase n=1 Tax=Marinicellulosiphila megalodicopiae TaxID=2724896 RepID=UPI003BB0CE16
MIKHIATASCVALLLASCDSLPFSGDDTETQTNTNQTNSSPVVMDATFTNGQFIASVSDADTPINQLTYTWYVGTEEIGTGSELMLSDVTVALSGTHNVRLVVSDGLNVSIETIHDVNFGSASNTGNTAPTISSANFNQNTKLLTAAAYDKETASSELSYEWSVDSQVIGRGASFNIDNSFVTLNGTKSVLLTVSDGDKTATRPVNNVNFGDDIDPTNAAPTISSATFNNNVLTAIATDDATGVNQLIYVWSVNSVEIGRDRIFNIDNSQVDLTGDQTVTLVVTDQGGKSASTTVVANFGTIVMPAGDESYSSLNDNYAQYDLFEIVNCGVNPTYIYGDYSSVTSASGASFGDTWNHIDSTTGQWAGIAKQPSDYAIATSLSSNAANCNNQSTLNNILVKKFGDWDMQHANGFNIIVPNDPTYADLNMLVMDIFVDSSNSVLPTPAEISATFGSVMSQSDINEMTDGQFHVDVQLTSDNAYSASIDLTLDVATQLDKWIRVEVPVQDMTFWQDVNYNRVGQNWADMKNMTVNTISFVAETKNRLVYRNYNQNGFDANTAPKLFKEQAIQIKYIEIIGSNQTNPTNNAPTVNIGSNQTVNVGQIVSINSNVNDVDGDNLDYQWKINNNNHSTSNNFSDSFDQAGNYDVSLSVFDGTVTTTETITIKVESVGSACAQSGTPVEMYGDLYTDGNKLKGCGGKDVQLRGMSMFWSQWSGQFYNSGVVDTLVDDWKVNAVRAAMGVDADAGYLDGGQAAELANVETMINAALNRGVYVIVDWHTHHGEDANIKSSAITFFEDIARRYGDNPNIIYEIYNEPLDVTWDAVLKPYAEDVIRAIRAIDPDNLIIAGTQNWSQEVDDAGRNPITNYPNIAYTIHFYACTHKDDIRANVQSAIDNNVVVFATEWGMSQANGGTNGTYPNTTNDNTICADETTKWLDLFDANNISWFNWSLIDKEESSAALKPGASVTGGWNPNSDLSPSGQWVRNKLRSY